MSHSLEAEVCLSKLNEHLQEFSEKLNCNQKFLALFRAAEILQDNEIEAIQKEAQSRTQNCVFSQYIIQKLNQDDGTADEAASVLKTALQCTKQMELLKIISNGQADKSVCDIVSVQPCKIIPEKYQCGKAYKMSEPRRGYCLIINIENFKQKEERRKGSEVDVDNLKKVFEGHNFKVKIKKELTAVKITKAVETLVSKMKKSKPDKYGMIVLVLMSHGDREGIIYGSDGERVDRYDLYRKVYTCKALDGKPKFFVVQACAGGDVKKDELDKKTLKQPENNSDNQQLESPEDTLIINSSFEGFASIRNEGQGSYFITALVKTLAKYSGQWHLEKICKMVQNEIRAMPPRKIENKDNKCYEYYRIPTPCYLYVLQKKLYLLPGLTDIGIPREVEANIGYSENEDEVGEGQPYNYSQPRIEMTLKPSTKKMKYFPNSDKVYPMSSRKRGQCVVINISGLKDDANDLQRVFEALKFDVVVIQEDLTTSENIEKALDAQLELEHRNYDMFVLVIMSRGSKRAWIGGSDSAPVDQHKLRMKVCHCTALKKKPKFFIIDSFYSGEFKCIEYGNDEVRKEAVEDVLILDSSLDGVGNQMIKDEQSLFIRVLVNVLWQHSSEWHLEKICKKIQDEMRKLRISAGDNTLQIPCYASFLRLKLFLFPGFTDKASEQVDDPSENVDIKVPTGKSGIDPGQVDEGADGGHSAL